MNLIDVIRYDDTVYLFSSETDADLEHLQKEYEKQNNSKSNFPILLWYEKPKEAYLSFLWNKHRCIRLWYDGDIDFAHDAECLFKSLIVNQ